MASCFTTVQLTTRVHFDMSYMHDAPASKRDYHTPLALTTSCRLSSADSHYITCQIDCVSAAAASSRINTALLSLRRRKMTRVEIDAFFRASILQVSKSPPYSCTPGKAWHEDDSTSVAWDSSHVEGKRARESRTKSMSNRFAVQSRDRTLVIPMRTV